MTELETYLNAAGYQPRKAQTDLYDHLIKADRDGVVAQAGTGTGKSAAVISAAAHAARKSGEQSIIVTPTLTLMNQYISTDLPVAEDAFDDLQFAELRGRSHYFCEQTKNGSLEEYTKGCDGFEGGCTNEAWLDTGYRCDYREAKGLAMAADVVVTNSDMLIVNDKLLEPMGAHIFSLDGALFVDEAHTLEMKLRDYASRSTHWSSIERFRFAPAALVDQLASWLKRQDRNLALKDTRGFPYAALLAVANAEIPDARPKDGLKRQRETCEAAARIVAYMDDPHEHAVLHVSDGSLKMDWINVARSAGELLTARPFGLVSATVPRTMAAGLGVSDAPFIDVGHPFDYANQAWIGFSPYGGDYRSSQSETNQQQRIAAVKDLLERSGGGALILFSSFKDLENVSEALRPWLLSKGINILIQERGMDPADRQAMADEFKADGNAVLFGSESFATGFDVPGNALRLVILWKLPYPAVDPVSNAIRNSSFARYEDLMKVRAVQAIGRLIRREDDKGIVYIADNRGRKLLDRTDPLTSHLPQFARLP